jgi:1,4-dihydroxy-2-naphthoate octaprenyltransferase
LTCVLRLTKSVDAWFFWRKQSFGRTSRIGVVSAKICCFLLGLSIIANLLFTVCYGYQFWFFVFGLLGGLLGWFYTAPPLKLAYRGLGEFSTMLAVGLLMPGMGYFVASGDIGPLLQLFVLPLSCYGLFFIITVELPDFESDAIGQKKSLLVKWGRNAGKLISVVATLAGTISLILLFFLGTTKGIIDLTPFIAFSIFPLIASLIGFALNSKNRKNIVRQVMINMTSMILFLFLMDVSLFFQFVYS